MLTAILPDRRAVGTSAACPDPYASSTSRTGGSASGRTFASAGICRRTAATRSRSSVGPHDLLAVARLGHHAAPRVHHHRVAPGRDRARPARAAATRRDDPCPVLDRARPQQRLPVVAAGPRREDGRDREHRRAGQCEGPVELREAQVVADGQAHPDAVHRGDDRAVARHHAAPTRCRTGRRPRRRRTGAASGSARRRRPSGRTAPPCSRAVPGRPTPPRGTPRAPSSRASRATAASGAVVGPGTGAGGGAGTRPPNRGTARTPAGPRGRHPAAASRARVAACAMLASTSSRASSWTRATRSVCIDGWYGARRRWTTRPSTRPTGRVDPFTTAGIQSGQPPPESHPGHGLSKRRTRIALHRGDRT